MCVCSIATTQDITMYHTCLSVCPSLATITKVLTRQSNTVHARYIMVFKLRQGVQPHVCLQHCHYTGYHNASHMSVCASFLSNNNQSPYKTIKYSAGYIMVFKLRQGIQPHMCLQHCHYTGYHNASHMSVCASFLSNNNQSPYKTIKYSVG